MEIKMSGEIGNEILFGGSGHDIMNGEDGNNLLFGGTGEDALSGGKGKDYFICGLGKDEVTDFNRAEGDGKSFNFGS
jgi:uncharacterized protein